MLQRYVTAEPEIKDEPLTARDEFLLLASDGLWDVVPNQDAVSLVRGIALPEEMARVLIDEAYRRGSVDNITCLCIRFNSPAVGNGQMPMGGGMAPQQQQHQSMNNSLPPNPGPYLGPGPGYNGGGAQSARVSYFA